MKKKKRKSKFDIWDVIILILLIITGYGLYYTDSMRVQLGYFESSVWITLNALCYVTFFGLVTGYIIGKLVKRAGQ